MFPRNLSEALAILAVLILIGVGLAGHKRHANVAGKVNASPNLNTASPSVALGSAKSPQAVSSPPIQMVELSPTQVVAAVNGRELKLADIVPVTGNNPEIAMDKATLDYYLKRAVDRELIFEMAKTKGIALTDSQNLQIAGEQSMQNQPEPGGIAKLNDTPAARQLEIQDDMAFMLQTAMLAEQGDSPNVSESQVAAYYQQHQTDFETLPADAEERQRAWQRLDAQIRWQLEPSVRALYNIRLADFMRGLEAKANITVTPVADFTR